MSRVKLFLFFFLLIVTFGVIPAYTCAQSLQGQQLADSLQHVLLTAKDDTVKAKALYRLARIYASNDSAQASAYANKCLQLSQKLNWQTGIGLSYIAIAVIHNNVSDYSTALQNAKKAQDIFIQINSTKNIGAVLITMGISYSGSGIYAKAIECYFKALKYYESVNDKQNVSNAYMDIGVSYFYLKIYDKAIENYKKGLQLSRINKDTFGIGSNIDNIAITYLDEGKYDSANMYNLQAIPFFEASNDLPGLGRIYGNRGNILMRLHNAKQAYEFYSRSMAINKKLDIIGGIGSEYGNMGELYLEIANDSASKYTIASFMKKDKKTLLDSSRYYLLKAIDTNKKSGDIELLMVEDTLLSQTEEALGNYKEALAAFRNYTLYKDSIFNDANKQKVQALETERLTEVKDQQIELLNKQKALETSEVKRQTLIRNTIITAFASVAVFAFLVIYFYNRRRKAKFDNQVLDVEMKALRSQMNPHFIFNSLHSINKYVLENDKDNASSYLSKFASLMRLILENSREQEVPLEKDLHALELYMQLEALRANNKFKYSIETDPEIDKENTLIPPMLLQPFVENAILHGVQHKQDGMIKIKVNKVNEMICCIIEDNGNEEQSGLVLKTGESEMHKSLGKKIISERLNVINQIKKVKTSVNIFDLKDAYNKPAGMRIELLLPLELAF